MVTPAKKLEDLIHLAELCVDLLQQNEEHYAEVIQLYIFIEERKIVTVCNNFGVSRMAFLDRNGSARSLSSGLLQDFDCLKLVKHLNGSSKW